MRTELTCIEDEPHAADQRTRTCNPFFQARPPRFALTPLATCANTHTRNPFLHIHRPPIALTPLATCANTHTRNPFLCPRLPRFALTPLDTSACTLTDNAFPQDHPPRVEPTSPATDPHAHTNDPSLQTNATLTRHEPRAAAVRTHTGNPVSQANSTRTDRAPNPTDAQTITDHSGMEQDTTRPGAIHMGLEEEVFVVDADGHPDPDGLYALARLLAKHPRYYYTRTAANSPRRADLKLSRVGSIEIATGIHRSPESLVDELARLRADLSAACPSRIVAVGMLPGLPEAPTIVAALQLHVSGVSDRMRALRAFLYFAPALALLTANAPAAGGMYGALSLRILRNPFIGVPGSDPYERFADVIISRRLGTIELRLFDPCPQLERVRSLARAVFAVAALAETRDFSYDADAYARLREASARVGCEDARVRERCLELSELAGIQLEEFENPPALETWRLFSERGVASYDELDARYRAGVHFSGVSLPHALRTLIGVCGWHLPRLPYGGYKVLKEHGYL